MRRQPKGLLKHIITHLVVPLILLLTITFLCVAWIQQKLIYQEFTQQAAILVNQITATRSLILSYDGFWVPENRGAWVEERNGFYRKTSAILTKELSKETDQQGLYKIRMVAARPANLENLPSAPEMKALQAFEQGAQLFTTSYREDGRNYFLYMVPVITYKGCVKCHAVDGYQEGSIRGGLGVILPLDKTQGAIISSYVFYAGFSGAIILLAMLFIYLFYSYKLALPLKQLNLATETLGAGNLDFRMEMDTDSKEFVQIARGFNEMAEKLQASYRGMANLANRNLELHTKNVELDQRAKTDGLTGLFNHMSFHSTVDLFIQEKIKFAVALMDIDNFKTINDTHGHLVGDEVLRTISRVLRQVIRNDDTAFRYGGEEFAVLLPDVDYSGAFAISERIRQAVEEATTVAGDIEIKVTVSIGVACYPRHGSTKDQIISCADENLYQAKRAGKNVVVIAGIKKEMLE